MTPLGGEPAFEDEDDPFADLRALNEQFYKDVDPGGYIRSRLYGLLAMGGATEAFCEIFNAHHPELAGMVVSGLSPASPEDVRDFVTIEAVVLLHHAAEATLRTYLAHEASAAVPWVEVAANRPYVKFEKQVNARFRERSDPPDSATIGRVVCGSETAPGEVVSAVTAHLEWLANAFINDADLYNSFKHGMAAVPSSAELTFGNDAGVTVASIDGEVVEYLECSEQYRQEGVSVRDWYHVTRWIDVGQALGMIWVAAELCDAMMATGKVSRFGGTISISVPTNSPNDFGRKRPVSGATIRRPIGTRET